MPKVRIRRIISAMVRAYLSRFPWDKGKWRLWTLVHPYLGKDGFRPGTYRTKDGLKVRLDPELYNNRFVYYWGVWEPDETRVIQTLLREGDVFLDVGANVGFFTLVAAQAVGDRGRVIAIEAVPPTAARLKENVALNGFRNVSVYELAAMDGPGPVKIAKHGLQDRSGQHSLRFTGEDQPFWEVPGAAMDQLPMAKEVAFIKMDIEGAEMLALKGLKKTLERRRAPVILCEVTHSFLSDLGSSADELHRYLQDLDYRYQYDCHGGELTAYCHRAGSTEGFQRNIVFSKTPLTTSRQAARGWGSQWLSWGRSLSKTRDGA